MNIKITADSTSDLSPELQQRYHVSLTPLYIIKEDNTYIDGMDITPQDIFESVNRTGKVCHTAAPNIKDYSTFFAPFANDYDAVLHFNISNFFSSCHQNAVMASKEFNNVYVVDSLNLSTGIGHLVLDAAEMAEAGETIDQILKEIENRIPKVESSFMIDTLKYLHMGGRCSSVAALGANLLKLKPCIEVKDGKMLVGKKYRGIYKNVIESYIMDRLHERTDINPKKVFITHSPSDAEIIQIAYDAVKKYGNFETIIETDAGCSISNHCGPNTLGILFERQ